MGSQLAKSTQSASYQGTGSVHSAGGGKTMGSCTQTLLSGDRYLDKWLFLLSWALVFSTWYNVGMDRTDWLECILVCI